MSVSPMGLRGERAGGMGMGTGRRAWVEGTDSTKGNRRHKRMGLCLAVVMVAFLVSCGRQEDGAVQSGKEDTCGREESGTVEEAGNRRNEETAGKTAEETGAFQVPLVEWRLAEPVYEKLDHVVYGLCITDLGLEPGDGQDITGRLQAALFSLRNAGGGTLYLPAGEYRLDGTIIIPKGVTICGDWKEPAEEDRSVAGTVLMIYGGRGSRGTAQFILQPNSCIRDLTIYYPEQTVEDIKPYPATIQLYDPSVWGADYTHVKNVTLVNSYVGVVQGPNGNGCPNVHNLYGTTLAMGLSMDGSADVGRCDYIDLSADYWIDSGYFGNQDGEMLRRYLYENATGISIGRVDWSYYTNTRVEGYAVGMRLREGELSEMGNYPNGQVYRHTYEGCAVGLLVEGTSQAGEEFAEIQIKDCDVGIRVTDNPDTAQGQLQFYRTDVSARTYAVRHEGEEDISFLDCVMQGDVSAEKGTLLLAATQADTVSGARVIRVQDFELPQVSQAPDMVTPAHKVPGKALYVYGEEPSDQEDQTASLQAFLEQVGKAGGGIAFVPPGEYCVRGALTVPGGVELKGAVDIGRNPIRLGTIFRIRKGTGGDEASVQLEADSGISGIVFDYPEQDFADPEPYPYTIQGKGENIFLVNVSLRGAYRGVDLMTERCDNHYVEYLSGICLENGIQVGGGSTGGKIYNYQMNFIILTAGEESKFGSWDNSPTGDTEPEEEAALKKYLQEHLVVLRVGDVKEELLYDNFSYNGWRGIQFVEENGRGASGWCIGQGIDYSTVAVEIGALDDMGFVNSQLVSYRDPGTEGGPVCHILVHGQAQAQFVNMTCWAKPDTANLYAEEGRLSLWNMHVADVPAVSVCAYPDADVSVVNASYQNRGEFYLTDSKEGQIAVAGMAYNANVFGMEDARVEYACNRKERVDLPDNALPVEGRIVMAEGFTRHPAMEGEGRYLTPAGNFDQIQPPGRDAYVGLVEQDGNSYARLYCAQNAGSAYLRSGSVVLEQGNVYEMELRYAISGLDRNKDCGWICSVEGIGEKGTLGAELLFGCYGYRAFSVKGEELFTWEEDTWYRVRVTFDLQASEKKIGVELLDDMGERLALSSRNLRDVLQGECFLGNLQMAVTGSMAADSTENDILLDYCVIYQK